MASLYSIYKNFVVQTENLREIFDVPLPRDSKTSAACSPAHARSKEMCVIALYDAWARFCRALVIASAADSPRTLKGNKIPRAPGIRRKADVIPSLLSTYGRRKFEPRWADATETIDAAKRIGIRNEQTISIA